MTSLGERFTDHLRDTDAAVTVAWVAVVAGGLVRLLHFATRRSLWADEAALAVNIVQRDFAGLVQPLDGNQGAPVLFLWLERIMVLVGGNNEYALRVLPLVAGLALLPLVYLLGRRIGSPVVGAASAVLVAVSPTLVRYSTEVKQYSVDAALAVALILAAIVAIDRDLDGRMLAVLAGGGAIAIWASHPAMFVVAGIGLVLGVHVLRDRDRSQMVALFLVGCAWAVSAGALYVVSLSQLQDNEFLTAYWTDGFPPRPLSARGVLRWLADATLGIASDPVGLALPAVALAACAAGVAVLVRGHRWRAILLGAPIPFLLIAATVERYPLRGRLVLFLVPLALVGISGLLLERRWRLLTVPLIGVLAAGGALDVVRSVVDPPEFADSRPVFEHVAANALSGDEIWVHDVTVEPYRYYGPITGIDAHRRTRWSTADDCRLESSGRVWVVFAYTLSSRPDDEADRLRAQLAQHGDILEVVTRTDASAALFDFGAMDDPASSDPELGCLTTAPEPSVAPSGLSTGPFGSGTTT